MRASSVLRYLSLFTCIPLAAICAEPAKTTTAPAAVPEAPLFAATPLLDIGGKQDFPAATKPQADAASELKGLCSIEEFRALPAADRHVYSFDVWPGTDDKLAGKSYSFNFLLGNKAGSQKVAFIPSGGGAGSKISLARGGVATGPRTLVGFGNLDWSGVSLHTYKFDKPVIAFGVVLRSSADFEVRKFYYPNAKELNGYPVSYTLADGTLIQLGEREVRGALVKSGTDTFLGVIDRTGRGIVSVSYTLRGLAGNKAQSISMSHLVFASAPKPAVSAVINLRTSCDFLSADAIKQAPEPKLAGLSTLEDFRFIVGSHRYVYRFDTWPKKTPDLGTNTAEFAFDLKGKGAIGQKVTISAVNPAKNARLVHAQLKGDDTLSYPVLGGLGDIGNGGWTEQTFTFAKPVWGFGVTYRSPADVTLAAASADGVSPVSYTLGDGTVVKLGAPGEAPGILTKIDKTFVGVIDTTDKGISSITVRVQGTAAGAQPIYIEDLAFALAGPPPGNWTLVVDDQFDGDTLNPKLWATGYTFADIINNELQAFVPENVIVANGVCTIKVEARQAQNTDRKGHKKGVQKIASGAFTSFDKFTPTYGYFEARVKMPKARGAGVWPAFWMLPDRGPDYPEGIRSNYRTKNYGTGIEIDIFEFMPSWKQADGRFPIHMGCIWSYGKVTPTDPAPHGYGAYAQDNDGWGPRELTYKNADTEFHTYGLYWSPERLIFYLDSKPVFRIKDPKHVPDVPHYFLFNVSITGNGWGKTPDKKHPTTQQIFDDLPNAMEIDYFRAYSGVLEEALPPSPTDNPSIVRKYTPPPKDMPLPKPAAPAPADPAPAPTDDVPAAPVNSTISTPSSG
jgi:beta-glucanase (GH16 family)